MARLHRLALVAAATAVGAAVLAVPSVTHAAPGEGHDGEVGTPSSTGEPVPDSARDWARDSARGTARSYVVRQGDYLIGIALTEGVRLADLLRANGLGLTSLIVPGQRLVIPGTGNATGSSPTGSNTNSSPTGDNTGSSSTGATGAGSGAVHVVRWGDTLSGIAGRYGVSLSSLLAANDLRVTSLIVPGMRLQLPANATGATPDSSTGSSGSSAGTSTGSNTGNTGSNAGSTGNGGTGAGAGAVHVVRWGDTLSGIAGRYGVSLSSLLAANDLRVTSLIVPGMRLQLPAHATGATPGTSTGSSGSSAGTSPGSSAGSSAGTSPGPSGISSGSPATGIDAVVQYALAQVGRPYQFFSRGPDSFDCSGLTLAAYERIGIRLVHYSAYQATQGRAVDFHNEPIRPGDLVFLATRGSERINHVGMAISATKWVHAPGTGRHVTVGWMPADSSITAVRRYVDS